MRSGVPSFIPLLDERESRKNDEMKQEPDLKTLKISKNDSIPILNDKRIHILLCCIFPHIYVDLYNKKSREIKQKQSIFNVHNSSGDIIIAEHRNTVKSHLINTPPTNNPARGSYMIFSTHSQK